MTGEATLYNGDEQRWKKNKALSCTISKIDHFPLFSLKSMMS